MLLEPMQPKYISTVDSGNLSGHLLTLQQGMMELLDQKILPAQTFDGLRDTLHDPQRCRRRRESCRRWSGEDRAITTLEQIDRLQTELSSPPSTLSAAWLLLDQQMRNVSGLLDLAEPESQ